MNEYPEKWISAFLTGTKVVEICELADISKKKYYQLKQDAAFQALLSERRDMMVSAAVDVLREAFIDNIRILREIAQDSGVSPQIRINSVSVQLSAFRDWVGIVDLQQRLERLEGTQRDENTTFSGGAVDADS